MSEPRLVVIGAGLAGLALAARVLASGREVLVLEAAERAGGQIQTLREAELIVELGAEGFVARSRAVPALCELLGIQGSLVEQLTTDTYALSDGAFRLLPPGEAARRLGFQVPEEELGRGIRSLAGGMAELTDTLLARLGDQRVRLGARVLGVESSPAGLSLDLGAGARESVGELVLATPARAAARLLAPLGLPAAQALTEAPVMSNVSVNLLYRREQLPSLPAGSGLLFPEQLASAGLRALSIVTHKFAGRAPPGVTLLRVFLRPSVEALASWDDARFAGEATRAIEAVLGATAAPERSWVSRWAEALPVISPAHRKNVTELDAALSALGVHVTGSAFHGAGIDAAAASAEALAARLTA